ncbi:tRNA-specific adenosine deaminase-like protein [Chloropicon primus]|uniref:Cytidine deaminase-like protein n=1 Tax=Chloropicon primus TaxID=1764295 RepID=A0A5B8MV63_9CHLO|nr:cytidine deaminase-like protein [Chloropicon primus]UPR03454.1 tRNA-specific adenosine deaminase-like protein [Chloropicon primus]|eukprot:QDZ24247.1 cytidine deaminase-like protein [Chloropicon primus]
MREERWVFEEEPTHIPARDKPKLECSQVVIATVEKKHCGEVLKVLTREAPLGEYKHVKRIRNRAVEEGKGLEGETKANGKGRADVLEVVVCTSHPQEGGGWPVGTRGVEGGEPRGAAAAAGVQGDAWECMPSALKSVLLPLVCRVSLAEVPRHSPEDREQLQDWNRVWPVSYKVPAGKVVTRSAKIKVSEEDKHEMLKHLGLVRELATGESGQRREAGCGACNAAVIVNPTTKEVVGLGQDQTKSTDWTTWDSRLVHAPSPLRHAAMVAIENVAEGVRSWGNKRKRSDTETGGDTAPSVSDRGDGDPEAEPYLCTGFDCYLWREPCTMCAMALVHSRVRRITFCVPDPKWGALGGAFRLHSLTSLNHHYEVFHWPVIEASKP